MDVPLGGEGLEKANKAPALTRMMSNQRQTRLGAEIAGEEDEVWRL